MRYVGGEETEGEIGTSSSRELAEQHLDFEVKGGFLVPRDDVELATELHEMAQFDLLLAVPDHECLCGECVCLIVDATRPQAVRSDRINLLPTLTNRLC